MTTSARPSAMGSSIVNARQLRDLPYTLPPDSTITGKCVLVRKTKITSNDYAARVVCTLDNVAFPTDTSDDAYECQSGDTASRAVRRNVSLHILPHASISELGPEACDRFLETASTILRGVMLKQVTVSLSGAVIQRIESERSHKTVIIECHGNRSFAMEGGRTRTLILGTAVGIASGWGADDQIYHLLAHLRNG
jgi:hypothetical protein